MSDDTAIARFRFHFRRLLFEKNRQAGEVSRRAGLSPAWASSLKQGAGVSLGAADAVAEVLGVDVSEFFGPQVYHQQGLAPEPPPEMTPLEALAIVKALTGARIVPVAPAAIKPVLPRPVPSSRPSRHPKTAVVRKPTNPNRRKK